MASFIDMLNQGLGAATGTPLGQLGINMMMQAGPQQGNPSGGVRLGQAFGGMAEMQQKQQMAEYQKMLREQQMGELAFRKSKYEQEQAQRERLKQLVRENPDMIQNPMVRTMIGEFGDTAMAEQLSKLQPAGPKIGAMPFESQVTLPTGEVQMQRVNPQTFKYEPVGQPFRPTAQQAIDQRGQQYGATNEFKERDLKLEADRLEATKANQAANEQRAQAARLDAERKAQAANLKNLMGSKDLESKYNGVVSQFDQNIKMVDDLLKEEGFNSNFGVVGQIPNVPGTAAANTRALLDQFIAKAGLTELTKLKEQGVSLTPVSNTDLQQATTSALNLSPRQSADAARGVLNKYRESLVTAKGEAAGSYGQMRDLYKIDTTPPASAGPSRINDDQGYNALPSGAEFIGPDGVRRRKP